MSNNLDAQNVETTNSSVITNTTTSTGGGSAITFTKSIETRMTSTFNEPANDSPPKQHDLIKNGFSFSVSFNLKYNTAFAWPEVYYRHRAVNGSCKFERNYL